MHDISQFIPNFKKWLKESDEAKEWHQEREERIVWYKKHLSEGRIGKLTQAEFSKLIKDLWATRIWQNKDYKVKKLLDDNGLEKLRISLKNLLYGEDPIDKRWDSFQVSIKGLGPSSISEILTFSDPGQFAIANLKPLSLLPVLGIVEEREVRRISYHSLKRGRNYLKLIDHLSRVRNILQESGLKDADFITTDFFVVYLFYQVFELEFARDKETKVKEKLGFEAPRKEEPEVEIQLPKRQLNIADHNSAQLVLLKLGRMLGYDTYTPDKGGSAMGEKFADFITLREIPPFTHPDLLDTVKMIDVIWFKEEWPEFCFEVEHTTGVSPGLLRLYQVKKLTNVGLYIIGPEEVQSKFSAEVNKEPFRRSKDRFVFQSYKELAQFYLLAGNYYEARKIFFRTRG